MWTIDMRGEENEPKRLIFVFDDEDVLRWSGPTLLGALRYLAEWGQVRVEIDVDSAIWWFGPEDAG